MNSKLQDYFTGNKLNLDKARELLNPSIVYDYIHDRITREQLIKKMEYMIETKCGNKLEWTV